MAERYELHKGDVGFPSMIAQEDSVRADTLFVYGSLDVFDCDTVSIIGARRATPYGIAIAEMAGRIAAESGIVVVSGGALGCDHAASRAALDAGGRTIIVSGCGADKIYPRSSTDIFTDAVRTGGAIVSLERWGSEPRRYNFPKRNVIIAALSPVLLVAEAGERSGTMSTVDAALELSRTIYAAPGSIFSPNSQGANRLVRDGAYPIVSESDLEMRLSLDYGVLRVVTQGESREVGEVMSALIASPARPDDLAPRLGQSVLTLLRTLSDYESKGIVERLPDGRYALTAQAYQQYRTSTQ